MENTWICPECGHVNSKELDFCEKCGASKNLLKETHEKQQAKSLIVEDSDFCPFCGKPIPKGAEKCPHCGADLTVSEVITSKKITVPPSPRTVNYYTTLLIIVSAIGLSFLVALIISSIAYFFGLWAIFNLGGIVGSIIYLTALIVIGLSFSFVNFSLVYILLVDLYDGTKTRLNFAKELKRYMGLALPGILLTILFLAFNNSIKYFAWVGIILAFYFPLIHILREHFHKFKEEYVYTKEN